jgi:hypothetical protein
VVKDKEVRYLSDGTRVQVDGKSPSGSWFLRVVDQISTTILMDEMEVLTDSFLTDMQPGMSFYHPISAETFLLITPYKYGQWTGNLYDEHGGVLLYGATRMESELRTDYRLLGAQVKRAADLPPLQDKCPLCGSPARHLFNMSECSKYSCKNFSRAVAR